MDLRFDISEAQGPALVMSCILKRWKSLFLFEEQRFFAQKDLLYNHWTF